MHRPLGFDPVISGDNSPAYNFTRIVRNLASVHTAQKILRKWCVLRRFYSDWDGHLRSKIVSLTYANGCATITLTPTRRYYL
jgi:hypothetical protein